MWVKAICSFFGVMILAGCWFRSVPSPPEWVVAPHSAYPSDQYLLGLGEGESRDQADKRAYGAVARIFFSRYSSHVT